MPSPGPVSSPGKGHPPGPLAGVRVVDCSTVLAGPYCTMVLGDLGADVVKVEPLEGDATRGWGPPWAGGTTAGAASTGAASTTAADTAAPPIARTATYFLAVNRNKRSLRLDLRSEGGRDVLRTLLRSADVVVENFRVGGFARLGFSDAELERLNPALVHLAISGYGTSGPDTAKPGYDFVIQAVSGLMSITGRPDGEPTKVGVAISDVVTGMFGAISILASLLARGVPARPTATDVGADGGQRIDLGLLQSTLAVLVNQAQSTLVTGAPPGRLGNAHPSIVPYETFATTDGEVAIGVGSDRQWQSLCAALELPELAADARLATNAGRVEHRADLIPLLERRLAERPTVAWLEALDAAGVPAGPILDVRQAFSTPQAIATGARVPLSHPVLGPVDQVGIPYGLSMTPASIRTPPPLLGEHSREILTEAGYDADAIDRLVEAGVV